ncbi:unnamed protein product [Gongylonema pulchrum]|uniref:Uncharacterized protein n=1 Tax=Gongylonema pulchrum TaxID=637853 RepID=A0A183DQ18_9BILA|nr:unnamed protein product [Gongylonema pulchrum]
MCRQGRWCICTWLHRQIRNVHVWPSHVLSMSETSEI